jgi:hypothetical protein
MFFSKNVSLLIVGLVLFFLKKEPKTLALRGLLLVDTVSKNISPEGASSNQGI